jgi:sulfofructose kinase
VTGYVVCVGLATQDTIFRVSEHPSSDGRVVASELVLAGGGPAATAAVTLARLGVKVYFVGAVGYDQVGAEIRNDLDRARVDVSELALLPGRRSPQSTILVNGPHRAIVHYPGTAAPLELPPGAVELCRGAEWVHVDHHGYPAVPRDVRLSIDGGNPIPGLDVAGVELYAPTESRLAEVYGGARGALDAGAKLVVATRGELGSAAYLPDGSVVEAPAPEVDPVSTLGAGDVFHGALLAAFVRGRPLAEALAFANTCAALSCRALDGRSAIPTADEVPSA